MRATSAAYADHAMIEGLPSSSIGNASQRLDWMDGLSTLVLTNDGPDGGRAMSGRSTAANWAYAPSADTTGMTANAAGAGRHRSL
jgi:hypothetical protein